MGVVKTKRREVWVNDREGVLGGTCEEARSDAAMLGGRPVKFVEARPGDVVLSREDVATAAPLLASAELAVGLEFLPWHDSTEGSPEQRVVKDALAALKQIRALLRGGR